MRDASRPALRKPQCLGVKLPEPWKAARTWVSRLELAGEFLEGGGWLLPQADPGSLAVSEAGGWEGQEATGRCDPPAPRASLTRAASDSPGGAVLRLPSRFQITRASSSRPFRPGPAVTSLQLGQVDTADTPTSADPGHLFEEVCLAPSLAQHGLNEFPPLAGRV